MPSVTQNADGMTCSVTKNADGITHSLRIDNLSYEQVETLLGADRNTRPTTTNATSNNTSEYDSVKKHLRPFLFNNKHVQFSEVEEFKLDFNSFASTRGYFGAVNARTLEANRKAKSRAALRIIQAITKSGDNADERALALHLALINPAIREISKFCDDAVSVQYCQLRKLKINWNRIPKYTVPQVCTSNKMLASGRP
jgi:hypothetical protein